MLAGNSCFSKLEGGADSLFLHFIDTRSTVGPASRVIQSGWLITSRVLLDILARFAAAPGAQNRQPARKRNPVSLMAGCLACGTEILLCIAARRLNIGIAADSRFRFKRP